ncbi:MAG: glycosyl transferase, partial [Azospirillaceae bacterium]
MRVLFWVQHLLGIGHVRRAELIARALVEAGLEVTVAQGGFPVAGVGFGGAVVAALPPARVRDAHFSPLLGAGDRPVDDAWRTRRQAALLALAREVRPQIVLLETYPLGRRAFAFELDPLVALCRALPECRLVAASVRDILVRKAKPEKERQMAAAARRLVDLVLVHGDPAILPLE